MASYSVNERAVAQARRLIAEWRHKDIELTAHELLQHLDNTSA